MATIAGESGALGFSSDRLVLDSYMQEGTDIATIEKNRSNGIEDLSKKASQAQNQTLSSTTATFHAAPTIIGTGLQIGTDIYKGKTTAKTKAKI